MHSSTLPRNWNNFPIEIKIKIVKNLDLNSRLALRSCSVDDWKLVESVPLRKIIWLSLEEDEKGYHIRLKKNYYNRAEYQFKNFEEFQEKVLEILINVDYIRKFGIQLKETTENIKLTSGSQKLKVKKLSLDMRRAENCLQQVDASSLKKLNIHSYGIQISAELCNLTQFNSVDELEIFGPDIRDDQLIQLKSKKITISCRSLTLSGIWNFIEKRTSDLNFEKLRITCSDKDLYEAVKEEIFERGILDPEKFIHPSYPEFETYIDGFRDIEMSRIRTNSTTLSELKKVDRMIVKVDPSTGHYILYIKKNCDDITRLSFRKQKEFQKILTERMKNIDYIKHLEVTFPDGTRCWRFVPEGSSKQITVGYLKTYSDEPNGQLFFDLLKQIEPGHLKYIALNSFYTEDIRNDVYDMQQLIQAEYIVIRHCNVQDYQLMRLSATKINFGRATTYDINPRITASGANKFIKKCLLDLKNRHYDFQLVLTYQSKEYKEFVSILLEGLDVFSMKNDQKILEEFYPSEVIVNSNWKCIKLQLVIDRQFLGCKRIEV